MLVEYVVETITAVLDPAPWNRVTVVAGEDSDRLIWAAIDQVPVGGGPRVITVRHADELGTPERLIPLLKQKAALRGVHVLLVADAHELPRLPLTEEQERAHQRLGDLPPYMAALHDNAAAHVILCNRFDTSTESGKNGAVAWVLDQAEMPDAMARHLLNRAAGELRLVRDACVKISWLGLPVTTANLNALLPQEPIESFALALLRGERREATIALAALRLTAAEVSKIIGKLDADLDLIETIHDLLVKHAGSWKKTMSEMGPRAHLVPDLAEHAPRYTARRRAALRGLLAEADEVLRSGSAVGVPELLLASWAQP